MGVKLATGRRRGSPYLRRWSRFHRWTRSPGAGIRARRPDNRGGCRDLRITRVFSCAARGPKVRASFMFAGCCRWRSLAADGSSGASRGTRLGLIVTALGTELDPVHEACARFFEGDRSSWKGRFRPAWFTDTCGRRSFPPLRKVIKNPVQSGQAAPGWMAASARHISIMRLLSLGYETTDVRLCRLRKSPVTVLTSPDRRREVVLAPPRLPLLGLSRSVRFTKRFTEPVVDRGFAVLQQARPRTLRPVGSSRRLTSATPPRTSALGRRGMAHPARVRRADRPGEIIAGSVASGPDRATGRNSHE